MMRPVQRGSEEILRFASMHSRRTIVGQAHLLLHVEQLHRLMQLHSESFKRAGLLGTQKSA